MNHNNNNIVKNGTQFYELPSRIRGVHGLRLPPSTTRSGAVYGIPWSPSESQSYRKYNGNVRGFKWIRRIFQRYMGRFMAALMLLSLIYIGCMFLILAHKVNEPVHEFNAQTIFDRKLVSKTRDILGASYNAENGVQKEKMHISAAIHKWNKAGGIATLLNAKLEHDLNFNYGGDNTRSIESKDDSEDFELNMTMNKDEDDDGDPQNVDVGGNSRRPTRHTSRASIQATYENYDFGQIAKGSTMKKDRFGSSRKQKSTKIKSNAGNMIGQTDYALASTGATIVRSSLSLQDRVLELKLFKLPAIPLLYEFSDPSKAIQTLVELGNCWAMNGTSGYLVIKLVCRIRPTSFSLEHTQREDDSTANLSAPREFTVTGLTNPWDTEGTFLGRYVYKDNGKAVQTFEMKVSDVGSFEYVHLQIHNNHGRHDYTCLYRFRVHGKPD